jgi:hypothetical protein
MRRQSEWLLRLPEILATLTSTNSHVLDRTAFELLFRVRRRRAIQLMGVFGGFQSGRTFLVDRQELVARITSLLDGEEFTYEKGRRERVSEELERVRTHLKGVARFRSRLPCCVNASTLSNLPSGVELRAGELVVRFESSEELLQKLFTLAQALASDYEKLQELMNVTP